MARRSLAAAWTLTMLLVAAGQCAQPQGQSAHIPRRSNGTPRSDWEIVFEDEITPDEYARELEFFKIEIAAASKDGSIDYISDLLKRKPTRRAGREASDYRVYIRWRKGTLYTADRRLLTRAGVTSEGKELRHYLPAAVETQLAALERDFAKRDAAEIRRTRFALRAKTDGKTYEFVVVEQDPPRPAAPRKSNSENVPSESAGR